MPRHDLDIRIPAAQIINTDVTVDVKSGDERLGTLLISRGSIDWRPRNGRYVRRLSWERFNDLMEEYGRHREIG